MKKIKTYKDGGKFYTDGMDISRNTEEPVEEIELLETTTNEQFNKIKSGKYTQKELDKLTKTKKVNKMYSPDNMAGRK